MFDGEETYFYYCAECKKANTDKSILWACVNEGKGKTIVCRGCGKVIDTAGDGIKTGYYASAWQPTSTYSEIGPVVDWKTKQIRRRKHSHIVLQSKRTFGERLARLIVNPISYLVNGRWEL